MREASRPSGGAVSCGELVGGKGRMVVRAWWGVLAEMWCHVRE